MSVQQRGQHNVLYSSSDNSLVEGDWSMIAQIESESSNEEELQSALLANLSNFHPRVIMFLRQEVESPSTDWGEDVSVTAEQVQRVGGALVHVLEDRMEGGRQVLKELLESGELRKLDGAIGHAARAGKLDMAFFTVLNANLQDAVSTEVKGEDASRLQILQHIYTRCQEEVEKTVAPGIGLLNKLLRTEVSSIRSNQLEHYLGPQPPTTTIITPDGKSVELKNSSSDPLVALNDFVQAMADSVKQIRTVEKAGGTDRATAAGLVESIRQLAMEARFVIAQVYAVDSDELKQFEDDLQPIFRPDSAESEYAKGE
eukprot:CAMPEP_0197833490 /NCGR_PEP_ID=MMETSP1437-20131217/19207_1 /TAXON_ID=49252 ORGANISM="Eucampia antarctica, Strain CCMP1452" /NCGR_SAMPLE_ID=MMETSP1437 /ASSEMBLY_ACC=CAM_ASM_001096 /LENGTH=313 /DNA_ID=CAMNT_0043437579 /DNA_START=166 /DNA_END=1107 /DNA_ORIENTATION=-